MSDVLYCEVVDQLVADAALKKVLTPAQLNELETLLAHDEVPDEEQLLEVLAGEQP
jgi:hypothetical protein